MLASGSRNTSAVFRGQRHKSPRGRDQSRRWSAARLGRSGRGPRKAPVTVCKRRMQRRALPRCRGGWSPGKWTAVILTVPTVIDVDITPPLRCGRKRGPHATGDEVTPRGIVRERYEDVASSSWLPNPKASSAAHMIRYVETCLDDAADGLGARTCHGLGWSGLRVAPSAILRRGVARDLRGHPWRPQERRRTSSIPATPPSKPPHRAEEGLHILAAPHLEGLVDVGVGVSGRYPGSKVARPAVTWRTRCRPT